MASRAADDVVDKRSPYRFVNMLVPVIAFASKRYDPAWKGEGCSKVNHVSGDRPAQNVEGIGKLVTPKYRYLFFYLIDDRAEEIIIPHDSASALRREYADV